MNQNEAINNINSTINKMYDAGIDIKVARLSNGGVFIDIPVIEDGNIYRGDITCTHKTDWRWMYGRNANIFHARPGTFIPDENINEFIEHIINIATGYTKNEKSKENDDQLLLSMDALNFLMTHGYNVKTHEQRMLLIAVAKDNDSRNRLNENAINWLMSVANTANSPKERKILIAAATIAYPIAYPA